MFLWVGAWDAHTITTPLERPSPNQKAKNVDNAAKHGDMTRLYVSASQLWGRLDTDNPTEPQGPEEGFGEEVIEVAKRGRDHVRVGIEESTVRAYDSCSSKGTTQTKHGGIPMIFIKNTMRICGPTP